MRSFDVAQERKCGASMRFELTRNCSRKENLLNITPRRDAPKRMNICNDLIEKKILHFDGISKTCIQIYSKIFQKKY